MTVYVDEAIHKFGRMVMCHMASPDVDELHAMAEKIGVARKWFQDPFTMNVSRPHYDIAKSKRALAVAAGAVEIDRYQMVVISNVALNRYCASRGAWIPIDPLWVFRGREDRIASSRLPGLEAWLQEQIGS